MTRIPSREQLGGKLQTVATLARAGIIRPQRPDRLLRAGAALARWGATPAAGYTAAAARYPDALGLNQLVPRCRIRVARAARRRGQVHK